MREKTSLSIIIPCYNEAANVPFFEKEFVSFIELASKSYPMLEIKIYLIDNNSTDSTYINLNELALKYSQFITLEQCKVQGYGAALKHGFSLANNSKFLGFCDFDNTYPLISFLELLDRIIDQNLDLVFGARLHKFSNIDFVRKFGNHIYVLMLKFFLRSPLTDVCSGMRIFKSELCSQVLQLAENDLSFSIQFTSHSIIRKWKLGEVPILYRKRVGSSKLSVIIDGFKFLSVLIKMTLTSKKNV